ncbi:hypothetical protein HanIR_Chr04g0174961 [Helianthus annuus]|nr:hypothetical protein HanIR_Chr04g0174961 [Helianthus annuus]
MYGTRQMNAMNAAEFGFCWKKKWGNMIGDECWKWEVELGIFLVPAVDGGNENYGDFR